HSAQHQPADHQRRAAQYSGNSHACHFHHRSLIGLPAATCPAASVAPYMPLMSILPALTRSARHGTARSPLRSTTSPLTVLPSIRPESRWTPRCVPCRSPVPPVNVNVTLSPLTCASPSDQGCPCTIAAPASFWNFCSSRA